MGNEDTPKVTVDIPPSVECPEGTDKCAEDIARQLVKDFFGHTNIKWNITVPPVTLLVHKGVNVEKREFPTEDWACLQDFLDSLRFRLSQLFDPFSIFDVETIVEDISQRIRDSLDVKEPKDIEEPVRPSVENVAITWLRDTLGLERRVRVGGIVAKVGRKDIRRNRKQAQAIRAARALKGLLDTLPRKEATALREALR